MQDVSVFTNKAFQVKLSHSYGHVVGHYYEYKKPCPTSDTFEVCRLLFQIEHSKRRCLWFYSGSNTLRIKPREPSQTENIRFFTKRVGIALAVRGAY